MTRLFSAYVLTPLSYLRHSVVGTALRRLITRATYARERTAVAAGLAQYRLTRGLTRTSPLLRRNIHRLEKGLVMQPRKAVFAEDYIHETVRAYEQALRVPDFDSAELQWAGAVLAAYFAALTNVPTLASLREEYRALASVQAAHTAPVPRAQQSIPKAEVRFADFHALCRQRRSVRWFTRESVPRDLIDQALSAALEAPSACNRQPLFFRYIDDQPEAARVASIAMGTAGYAHNIPALMIVLGDLSAFESARDRHLIYIDGALVAMQLMLALETLGLSSCPINWPDIEVLEQQMDRALELPKHIRPVMLLAIGYADPMGGVPYSAKKSSHSLLRTHNDYAS